jgi:hypothetical protein
MSRGIAMTKFKRRTAAVLRLSDYRKRSASPGSPIKTHSSAVRQHRVSVNIVNTGKRAELRFLARLCANG